MLQLRRHQEFRRTSCLFREKTEKEVRALWIEGSSLPWVSPSQQDRSSRWEHRAGQAPEGRGGTDIRRKIQPGVVPRRIWPNFRRTSLLRWPVLHREKERRSRRAAAEWIHQIGGDMLKSDLEELKREHPDGLEV